MDSIRERIDALSPAKRAALIQRLSQAPVEQIDQADHLNKRLAAYVVPHPECQPSMQELRRFLLEKLPDYMVPAAFVMLDDLPRTPNGKIDHGSLPEADQSVPEQTGDIVPPRNEVEALLTDIWIDVLGVNEIGVHDNFFEMGGDSILSIQIVARANQAGIKFTPQQLLQHPTISELAVFAAEVSVNQAEQDLVTGAQPLTPIQHWFFELDLAVPHHWNQALIFEASQDLNLTALEEALQHLLWHHDALRLRFVPDENGWQALYNESVNDIEIDSVDLSSHAHKDRISAIQAKANELQASFDLGDGELVRGVYFRLEDGQPGRLLIIIHHLVVDNVSWLILMEDLETAYQQCIRNESIKLPSKTTSYKQWAETLQHYAQSRQSLNEETDYWLSKSKMALESIPTDYEMQSMPAVISDQKFTTALSVIETQALIREVPAAYNTQINDVLLTALVQTLIAWTESEMVCIGMEGHGRESIVEGLDLSRTVGWFTTYYPLVLNLARTSNLETALKSIKEQLRLIPNYGMGYGLLRYLSPDKGLKTQLENLPQPQILFNYWGQYNPIRSESMLFQVAREPISSFYHLSNQRTHLLLINAHIYDDRLQTDWIYSDQVHQKTTIEHLSNAFIEHLQTLVAHCQSAEASGYTPSDFPEADLDQDSLDQFLDSIQQD